MKYLFWLSLILILAGCASRGSRHAFEDQISAYRGRDINTVISAWGPPANVYSLPNGDKMYTFIRSTSRRTPTTTTANISGNAGQVRGTARTSGGDVVVHSCRVDFTTNLQQRIYAYRFEGDRCLARERTE
jgi:hypothetical protein